MRSRIEKLITLMGLFKSLVLMYCPLILQIIGRNWQGLCLFSKRLERDHFVWPMTDTGRVSLTPAQLSMLLEGIDWRAPARTWRPELAG